MAIQANHPFTHSPIYIFPGDDAWDRERIDHEIDLINGVAEPAEGQVVQWSSVDDHPVVRFRNGTSRFALDTVRDYLIPTAKPTFVNMRRATLGQWTAIQSLMEREMIHREPVLDDSGKPVRGADGQPVMLASNVIGRTETLLAALRYSVEGIPDFDIKAPRLGLTDTQLDDLRIMLGDERFVVLGYACLSVNRSLNPIESFR